MAIIDPQPKGKPDRDFRQISLLAAVPAILVATPLIGFFLGRWLDGKLGTEPTLMLVGVILGFAAAGVEIYGLVKKSSAIEKDDEKRNGA